ncbi:MAG TPA: TonB-dependent receptor [Gammaproteobacteria bacterium]|nr:TonB-dependent receptor [Gammaproteobacteria bacterium]
MFARNSVKQAVRTALACGMVTSIIAAPAAFGQQVDQSQSAGNNASTIKLHNIEVTGSMIKRTSVETAQPVTIITAAQIKATGLSTIGGILEQLTSSGSALNTFANSGGNNSYTGGGQSNVDLRGLGAKRVLVLVNGKRWVTTLDGTVDLNTIPAAIIDHIEILQDGASAIYGSDAIAGVVNIITIKNFTGVEANAYMGVEMGNGHTAGKQQSYDFTAGTGNDRSNLVFSVSDTKDDGITSNSNPISNFQPGEIGNTGYGSRGSSALPQGRFIFIPPTSSTPNDPNNAPAPSTGLTSAQCPTTNFGTAANPNYEPNCDLTLPFGSPGTSPSDFVPFVGSKNHYDGYAPYNYLRTPDERYSIYTAGHYDLSDNITLTGSGFYTHRQSQQQAAPTPLFFASSSIAVNISANNQFNPFGFDLNTNAPIGPGLLELIGRRTIEFGARQYNESENTYRFDGGINGFFDAGGSEWDWDAGYIFSQDNETDTNYGSLNINNVRIAEGFPTTCAAVPFCTPINLFGGQSNPMTPAQLQFIGYTQQNQFINNQRVYYADITNSTLANLPAGPIGFAAGYQYLEHDGIFQPDSIAALGYDSFNPKVPVPTTSGRTAENAIYAEFDFPLLANLPLAKSMDLDIASRHTKYSGFSSTTSRAALKWQPTDAWLLRGSWSQGFRSPSLNELFQGVTNFSASLQDPCINWATSTSISPTVQQRCANGFGGILPVPPTYTTAGAGAAGGSINVLESGNQNLKPETSISQSIGFVYSPDWLAGFNTSVDYYKIEIENAIQQLGAQLVADGCYVQGNLGDCSRIVRTATGTIKALNDSQTNIGGTLTKGFDIDASYVIPTMSIGQFKADLSATYVQTFELLTPNGSGGQTITSLAGIHQNLGGGIYPDAIPRWRAKATLTWTTGNFTTLWDMRFVSSLQESCSDSFNGTASSLTNLGLCSNPNFTNNSLSTNRMPNMVYNDVQVKYNFDPTNMTFTFGIQNVFQKSPPYDPHGFESSLYDVPGDRFIYANIGWKY